MKKLAAPLSLALFAACAASSSSSDPVTSPPPSGGASTHPHEVRGVALDPTGAESRIRVALVQSSGSTSINYDGGPFALDSYTSEPCALVATTGDGRIDWVEGVEAGSEGHDLAPRAQGGFLTVELSGRDALRVGIGQGDTRTADKTVRASGLSRFVVPAGEVWVEAYDINDGRRRIFDRISVVVDPGAELAWAVDATADGN